MVRSRPVLTLGGPAVYNLFPMWNLHTRANIRFSTSRRELDQPCSHVVNSLFMSSPALRSSRITYPTQICMCISTKLCEKSCFF